MKSQSLFNFFHPYSSSGHAECSVDNTVETSLVQNPKTVRSTLEKNFMILVFFPRSNFDWKNVHPDA